MQEAWLAACLASSHAMHFACVRRRLFGKEPPSLLLLLLVAERAKQLLKKLQAHDREAGFFYSSLLEPAFHRSQPCPCSINLKDPYLQIETLSAHTSRPDKQQSRAKPQSGEWSP